MTAPAVSHGLAAILRAHHLPSRNVRCAFGSEFRNRTPQWGCSADSIGYRTFYRVTVRNSRIVAVDAIEGDTL